jgi:hypothetical protein
MHSVRRLLRGLLIARRSSLHTEIAYLQCSNFALTKEHSKTSTAYESLFIRETLKLYALLLSIECAKIDHLVDVVVLQ